MNRIEFMTELAALLQDVPIEERRDAMKYYNDYFDDAGESSEFRQRAWGIYGERLHGFQVRPQGYAGRQR